MICLSLFSSVHLSFFPRCFKFIQTMNSDPSLVSFEESFRDSSNRIDKTLKLMNENLGIKEHDKVMLYDFEDGVSSSLWSDIEVLQSAAI